MKTLITMLILAASVQLTSIVYGGDANDAGKGWRNHGERWASLSPDERDKMKAAHEKAMQDSAVQAAKLKMRQAHKEFRDAMHTAMLKADPTIQPLLDKLPKGEE